MSNSNSAHSCANNLSAWIRRASGNHVWWVCRTPNICVLCANCWGPQISRITPRFLGFFFLIDKTPKTCIPKVTVLSRCSCFCMRTSRVSTVFAIDYSHFELDKHCCAGLHYWNCYTGQWSLELPYVGLVQSRALQRTQTKTECSIDIVSGRTRKKPSLLNLVTFQCDEAIQRTKKEISKPAVAVGHSGEIRYIYGMDKKVINNFTN